MCALSYPSPFLCFVVFPVRDDVFTIETSTFKSALIKDCILISCASRTWMIIPRETAYPFQIRIEASFVVMYRDGVTREGVCEERGAEQLYSGLFYSLDRCGLCPSALRQSSKTTIIQARLQRPFLFGCTRFSSKTKSSR